MKHYDFEKVKAFIEKHANIIETASLGFNEDWFWTADTIYENKEFTVDLTDPELLIGGINGSVWATPTLEVTYFDGDSERIECSKGESTLSIGEQLVRQVKTEMSLGCMSKPVQKSRKGITRKI
jgi:hypothetical protein